MKDPRGVRLMASQNRVRSITRFMVPTIMLAICVPNSKSQAVSPKFTVRSCDHQIVGLRTKPVRFTKELSNRFTGAEVRNYISRLSGTRYTLEVSAEPAEFVSVVAAGKKAVPFLLNEMKSDDSTRRTAAWLAMSEISNRFFILPPGLQRLDVTKSLPNMEAYNEWWLRNERRSRAEWLLEDIASSDKEVAQRAISGLSEEGDSRAFPALRKALEEKNLRPYAIEALAKLGDRDVIPAIIETNLNDESPSARTERICYLYRMTGRTFSFDPNGTVTSRRASTEKWKRWWDATRQRQSRSSE